MRHGLCLGAWLFAVLPVAGQTPVDYLRDIKPVLKERCFSCHGSLKQKAGLRLDTVAAMRAGGDTGPAVLAGKTENSLLLQRITRAS